MLVTHVFVRGDALLASDSVFSVRDSSSWTSSRNPLGPGGRDLGHRPWSRVRFDIMLAQAAM